MFASIALNIKDSLQTEGGEKYLLADKMLAVLPVFQISGMMIFEAIVNDHNEYSHDSQGYHEDIVT